MECILLLKNVNDVMVIHGSIALFNEEKLERKEISRKKRHDKRSIKWQHK